MHTETPKSEGSSDNNKNIPRFDKRAASTIMNYCLTATNLLLKNLLSETDGRRGRGAEGRRSVASDNAVEGLVEPRRVENPQRGPRRAGARQISHGLAHPRNGRYIEIVEASTMAGRLAGYLEASVVRSVVEEILEGPRPGGHHRLLLVRGRRLPVRSLGMTTLAAARYPATQMSVPLLALGPLSGDASRQLRYLSARSSLEIGDFEIEPLVRLIYVSLQLGLVALELRFHVPEERGAVARVTDADRSLADVSGEIEVVLLAAGERIRRKRVESRLRKRFRIRIVVATVGRPLSSHYRLLEVDLVLLSSLELLLVLLAVPASARSTSGLLALLLALARRALRVLGLAPRLRVLRLAVLLPTLRARPTLAARLAYYFKDLGEILPARYVLGRLGLLVTQRPVAARLEKDPGQLPTAHRRCNVQSRVAVLER